MGVPTTSFAVAALIVLAVPGLIYTAIRRWAAGEQPEDRNPSLLFIRGLIFAVSLTSIYFLIFGGMLSAGVKIGTSGDQIALTQPRLVAAVVFALYILLPSALALVAVRKDVAWTRLSGWPKWLKVPRSKHNYTGVTTSWDHSMRRNPEAWVKVRRADGTWIGGWFTKGSHAAAYPESSTLYIDQQWKMSAGGAFEKPIPDTGVWIAIQGTDIVIWTKPDWDTPNEKSSA